MFDFYYLIPLVMTLVIYFVSQITHNRLHAEHIGDSNPPLEKLAAVGSLLILSALRHDRFILFVWLVFIVGDLVSL